MSKFLKSHSFNDSEASGDIAPYVLFDRPEPPFDLADKVKALYQGIDNTNVNILHLSDRMAKGDGDNTSVDHDMFFALSDFWQTYEFHPKTLNTLKHVSPSLPTWYMMGTHVPLPSSSHPVKEYGTENYINFVSYMSPTFGNFGNLMPNYINVIRIKPNNVRENIVSIPRNELPYMHALGLSQNYALIFADPLVINKYEILKTVEPVESLDWYPNKKTDLYVVNIHTGHTVNFQVPARVHMHHVNSYEKKKHILIIDYVAYPNLTFLKDLKVDTLHNSMLRNQIYPDSHLIRYRINLKRHTVKVKPFLKKAGKTDVPTRLDFPTINEEFRHSKHCYIYGVTLKADNKHLSSTALVKKSVCKGKDIVWMKENLYPSEAIFVPSPRRKYEDEGVLLSVVLNGNHRKSCLVIFDAQKLKVIAEGCIPDHIPFTLHGGFFSV